jgi:hypothetical protein
VSSPGGDEHDCGGGLCHHGDAGGVDLGPFGGGLVNRGHQGRQRDQGQDCQRDGDPEDPPPAGALGEPAAEERPGDRGQGEHPAHQAHVLAAVARRHEVGDRGLGQDDQAATAQALDDSGDDEPVHVRGQATDDRSDEEQHGCHHEHRLAAEQVATLAVDRHSIVEASM